MSLLRTVRGSIFFSVSLLLTGILLAFSLVVYDYASAMAQERFANALTSLSRTVMSNIDSGVEEMDRLCLTLIYSQVFQSLYAKHLELPETPTYDAQRIAKLENTEALIEITETILGPNQVAPQVNLFNFRGEMIGAGYYSQLIDRDAKTEPWYDMVIKAEGGQVLRPPHTDPFLENTSVIVKGKRYVSLFRTFRDPLLSTEGIIEVKQYCESLFGNLELLARSSVTSFVFDDSGNLFYPFNGRQVDVAALERIRLQAEGSTTVEGYIPGVPQPYIFAAAVSEDTKWTVLVGEPSAGLTASVFQYAARIALMTLVAIVGSLAASYFIARRVTVPIRSLHLEIEAVDIENLDKAADGTRRTDLGEIDELRLAFHEMRLKLNESIQEAVSLRAHEKEAQLVALQSQMNPHFLHNALQTIAIISEDGTAEDIQDLIANLAGILRYASSTEGTSATLGTEMEYTISYLAAMRARFGQSLEYVIDVPSDIRGVVVPRLILQPFIENCFKYATSNRPPWRIELRGTGNKRSWLIEILDNGPGFAESTLTRLTKSLGSVSTEDNGLPAISISGMGIINSYERLYLTFGTSARFEISNRPGGGARVAMGVDNGS